MQPPTLEIRELEPQDIAALVTYWLSAEAAYLTGMGVDLAKMPAKAQWEEMLTAQMATPLAQKQSYCLIWLLNKQAVGHCNVNQITYGESAFLHLHLWKPATHRRGLGTAFLAQSLPVFFRYLHLQKLISEPYAGNPAPHQALPKVGFQLVKEYTTTPGAINFEQPVKRWELPFTRFQHLNAAVTE